MYQPPPFMALDRAPPRRDLALDRASVRSYDKAGHLNVEVSNISKANVCPYYGREIPDYAALGLQPDRIYRLLRDPVELEKAAGTFTGKPLLLVHRPQMAGDHDHEITIGAIGTAEWSAPYLRAPLSIWVADGIKAVESGEQQELSSGYFYRAVMEPGLHEGEQYDGRMVDIVGNHVAIVAAGRAGPDVVVGDEQPKELQAMKLTPKAAQVKAALEPYLKPLMAADASLAGLDAILAGVPALALDEDDKDEDKKVAKDSEDADEDDKKAAKDEDDKDEDAVPKAAMDAAIRKVEADTIARMNAIRRAEREVAPFIGEVVAMDSAASVYKLALDHLKVDLTDVPPEAYGALLRALPKAPATPRVALDAAPAAGFDERWKRDIPVKHI